MDEKIFFNTIETTAVAEFKDRGSKFLGYAFPVSSAEAFKARLNAVKEEHPKATHHCFAYRIGLDGNNFRVSDDGEPSGSAGRPILGQIDSKQLTNILIVVVRYFGGTLLGVPGLINAYKTTAALVLQVTPVVQKQVTVPYKLHFDYTQMNEVMRNLKQMGCTVEQQQIQLFCDLMTAVPKSKEELFLAKMKNIQGLELVKL